MKKRNYFLFDVETGGLDENQHTLLTLYALILDSNLEVLDHCDLKLMPDDGVFHLDIEAMKVNKINILEHIKEAILMSQGASVLRTFLSKHHKAGGDYVEIVPVGHNVNMDIRFAKKLIPDFNKFCTRRILDTASIAQFFKLTGQLPEENPCSLESLCQHFNISTENHHNACADVTMTLRLLRRMVHENKCLLLPSLPPT